MHRELTGLLHTARFAFADDMPRLVVADWLEEHGDESDRERAAFVRFLLDAAPQRGGVKFISLPGQRWEASTRSSTSAA